MKKFKILVMCVIILTAASAFYASGEECQCTTTDKITTLGLDAGLANTTGENNTFLGHQAGQKNTTGNVNTFLGCRAGLFNTTGGYHTFLGLQAGMNNTTGVSNTFVGCTAGYGNTTGSSNTFIGRGAGTRNIAGSNNVFIGCLAGFNETGSNKLYIANGLEDSNVLIYGDFAAKKIGIAKTDPEYALDVGGDGKIRGTIVNPSDLRYKEDVKPIENALDKITNLKGVSFRWKNKTDDNGEQLGVIGQEVEKVFPEVVTTDTKGYKSVGYSNLVAPLIEAVKELKAENDKLKSRIQDLEKKMRNK
ncbi:MAG: tail fiber domain-containing protein [bacterium]|nr:tail fiber domain-containing protein [bacterium]